MAIAIPLQHNIKRPRFNASEIKGPGEELILCDLDGDHLKDVVMIEGTNLWIFYQGPKGAYPVAPSQVYRGGDKPGNGFRRCRYGGRLEAVRLIKSPAKPRLLAVLADGPHVMTAHVGDQQLD